MCELIDLSAIRAEITARRVSDAMQGCPIEPKVRKGDLILVGETGRRHVVWGFSAGGNPIVYVGCARTALAPGSWEALS